MYKRKPSLVHGVLIGIGGIVAVVVVWGIARSILGAHKASMPLAASATVFNTMLPKKLLVAKITELQTTLHAYETEHVLFETIMQENAQLKAELGRADHPKGVLAHVTTLPNRSLYDTFIIDAGTNNHISIGQTVYAFDSIALGTITDVAENYATVTLFSAAQREISGTVGVSTVSVTLSGRGGGEYEVRLPRDLPFAIGDVVMYQSVHTAVLAQIERIVTDPRDPFQRLIAKTPLNLQTLKWVIVR